MNIILKNITTGYRKESPIITDLSGEFSEGKIYGIIGPNGSGKTTLLRAISGLLAYSGSITLEDNDDKKELSDMKRKDIARHMALMPQFSNIYFSYTVYETVSFGRYVHGKRKDDREYIENALEITGLSDIASTQLSELSGGQLQRVLLARTIAQDTPIILLDEPTNHLDMKYQKELMDYLYSWCKESESPNPRTAICVFHDIAMAAVICDELLLMQDGKCIAKGPKEDILSADLLNDTFQIDVFDYFQRKNSALLDS